MTISSICAKGWSLHSDVIGNKQKINSL